MTAIAIVGMACRFPEARTPDELWDSVLTQRRAFRRIPPGRLRIEDYFSEHKTTPDATYSVQAALIDDYEFDRVRFRVSGTTFRSADLAHWLALDVAAESLENAGFSGGRGLPRETTGVIIGNTLTGEMTRANTLRLRWPYVRRVLDSALAREDWSDERRLEFLETVEKQYKAPFPPPDEETLAGSLSNTIAGRISNYFDLKGGAYTVDGACAASLLAVATAAQSLASKDLDVAIVGGVDISLDPFELVGFAKTSALARDQMRVFDARAAGFWPGEGCGAIVLMRYEDAVAESRHILAVIRGWGVSSDGSGGITRPTKDGQLLALQRAYQRAGFGIDSVSYFEAHGTGTTVGDLTEIAALSAARQKSNASHAAFVGSIKANIGHTKAAAGIAGLIKATMVLRTGICPPMPGCDDPIPELAHGGLMILPKSEPWPADRPLRAGVSAFGFGGINTHIVLEGNAREQSAGRSEPELPLVSSFQDCELFLFDAPDFASLDRMIEPIWSRAADLSFSEMADLTVELSLRLRGGAIRAAVVASDPFELEARLTMLRDWIRVGITERLDTGNSVFLGAAGKRRIGFLCPGQASPLHLDGGAMRRRFSIAAQFWKTHELSGNPGSTALAQPAVVRASIAGFRLLENFGVRADFAVGHSLGEITALCWAGCLSDDKAFHIAIERGRAMAAVPGPPGGMAVLTASAAEVQDLIQGSGVVIAGMNAPLQTAISGELSALQRAVELARSRQIAVTVLPVSCAFHSALLLPSIPAIRNCVSAAQAAAAEGAVVSTVTGTWLDPDMNIVQLLCDQVTSPVRFVEAIQKTAPTDLLIEIGPGKVLSGLAQQSTEAQVLAIDAGGSSLRGLWSAVGAAFAWGVDLCVAQLFSGRVTRPFDIAAKRRFIANPCESAPASIVRAPAPAKEQTAAFPRVPESECSSTNDIVCQVVATRVELPVDAVDLQHRLLSDLHLNSITVSEIVTQIARRMGLPALTAPTDFSDATVGDLARALDELRVTTSPAKPEQSVQPPGVETWIRVFESTFTPRSLPAISAPRTGAAQWRFLSLPEHPLRQSLENRFSTIPGTGVIVCLPPNPGDNCLDLLLEGARDALERGAGERFVVVQDGGGGAAFAHSLHRENAGLHVAVVDVPMDHDSAVDWITQETLACSKFTEAHYNHAGERSESVLRVARDEARPPVKLGRDDVLLISGGAKGIGAECALHLARETGLKLAILGRSEPGSDPEVTMNLRRMEQAGIAFQYVCADVTDAAAVDAAVRIAESKLGKTTAVLHAAARNNPELLKTMTDEELHATVAVKVQGARNVLACIDPEQLKLFVGFGSILARVGMRGEAHYALANEWLRLLVDAYQAEHPACCCLTLEWSLWSGAGMAERLGKVESVKQSGVSPIAVEDGVRILRTLLQRPPRSVSVIVSGRFFAASALGMDASPLPLLRFLERPKVYYPGIELVAEADLMPLADPYLDDHIFEGNRLFPAVMGLEAMAQAACALMSCHTAPVFEHVDFIRPISVGENGATTIRIAALVRAPDTVEVVIRSSETGFQVDHFRGICSTPPTNARAPLIECLREDMESPMPGEAAYSTILFQRGRFRRVLQYTHLRAKSCIAELAPPDQVSWFSPYLPDSLMTFDPALHDAAMHAIQACIPHSSVLPVGCARVSIFNHCAYSAGNTRLVAVERGRSANTLTYDLEIVDRGGQVCERWEGLRLHIVPNGFNRIPGDTRLLGPYLERRIEEQCAIEVGVLLERVSAAEVERQTRSNAAFATLLGATLPVSRQPNGKPEVDGLMTVSASHSGRLTLAVAAYQTIACDLEPVRPRTVGVWQDVLGCEHFALAQYLAMERSEPLDAACTRIWTCQECLRKVGQAADTPLVVCSLTSDGWAVLANGSHQIATLVCRVDFEESPLALGVLIHDSVKETFGTAEANVLTGGSAR